MTTQTDCREGTTIRPVATIEVTDCPRCGTLFGVEKGLLDSRRRSGELFYCPNGHGMSYRETEADTLRRQLAQEAKTRELLESRLRDAQELTERVKHSRAAIKGVLTQERNRIANGVCPCCRRQFTNLHRHMTTQHPEYTKDVPE
ncbi:MAG TPA: hypothetical protein VNH18_08115 [Bryobacteraceae bacterium]|nr:hypothetical protein [Bryobacteraceae bacterium]